MTIQERTDKYIHDRTCKVIEGMINDIRQKLLAHDNPMKDVTKALDGLIQSEFISLGMNYRSSIRTIGHEYKYNRENNHEFYEPIFVTDKFRETDLYKKAFAREFDKFWKETELRLEESSP